MQVDTQNQQGDQVIQGEEGEGGGDDEMPPRNIKVGKDNPPQGPAQCRKTAGGDEFWVNEEYQKLANLGASLQQFAEITHNEISNARYHITA